MGKLLRIPINRFETSKPLKENLLLELPKNRRNLRLIHAGEALESELLEKLKKNGVSYLCFLVDDNDARDPITCEIYQFPSDSSPTKEAITEAKTEPVIGISNTPQTLIEETQVETGPEIKSQEVETVLAKNAPTPILEEETIIGTSDTPDNTENRFSPNEPLPIEEQTFSKDKDMVDTLEQSFQSDVKVQEQELRFTNSKEEKAEETRFQSSRQEKLEEIRVKQGAKTKEEEEEFRFKSKEENKNEPEYSFSSTSTDSADASNGKSKVKSLQQLKDALLDGLEVDFPKSKPDLLNDAKSQILGTKIEKNLFDLLLSSNSDNENEIKASVRELETKLKKIASGRFEEEESAEAESTEEFQEFRTNLDQDPVPISEIMTSVQKIEQNRKISTEKLSSAYELEKSKLTRTNTPAKEAPITLSKLAAYLGSAIGYSNIDFLAELGLGAVIQYKERQGEDIKKDNVPKFTQKALWETNSPNSLIDDYHHILKFLEFYSADPLVDLKEKEFSKKIFERTIERAKNSNFSPDPLNLSQWIQFVEHGPSMDIHSNCSKASAKALKQAKDCNLL